MKLFKILRKFGSFVQKIWCAMQKEKEIKDFVPGLNN